MFGKVTSGVWNVYAHTAVFKINKQQEPTALNSAQCYAVAWKGRELRENGFVYM